MLRSLLVSSGIVLGSVLLVQRLVSGMISLEHRAVEPQSGQGIQGVVLRWRGNQMPAVDGPVRAEAQPVQTTVWIFAGRIAGSGSPRWALRHTAGQRLIKTLTSSADGTFAVQLPPGEYTLFAQYGEDLYLNMFLADGSFASVVIEPNHWVDLRLENTEAAFL